MRERLSHRRLVQAQRRHRARRPGQVHGLQPLRVGLPVRRPRTGCCSGTMKKCTLCVDRIYDTALPEEEREPACVLACPTHARLFGDFGDPDSKVSQMTRDRGGFGLLSELGYAPVNQYLPPRAPPRSAEDDGAAGTRPR